MNNTKIHTRKIAITGPESTGKSTIAKALATHYNSAWVPEYARDYLNSLKRPYTQEDLLLIAKGQIALENELLKAQNRFLFCDTDLLVLKIWAEYKYGKADPFILHNYQNSQYDLFLLMAIDLPWHHDPQREHPEKRKFFFDWFENELKQKNVNYVVVKGNQEERLQNAIKNIDLFFS